MSNYLELVNKLKDKTGSKAADLTTAVNLTGEGRMFAGFINDAWMDIQGQHTDWGWMRKSLTGFATEEGKAIYTPTEAGAVNFGVWDRDSFRVYPTTSGTVAESELDYISYDNWRRRFQFGASRTSHSAPKKITITPVKSIGLGPVPAEGYTVTGDYFSCPVEMTQDTDIPSLPAHYHMAIVYRAMMFYAAEEAATEIYVHGKTEFTRMMSRIENDYLPEIEMGSAE